MRLIFAGSKGWESWMVFGPALLFTIVKILALTNLYPPHYLGGYELICYRVVAALQSRGHEISVLTSDHRVTGVEETTSEPGVERSLRIHGFYGHPWLGIHQLQALERFNNRTLLAALKKHCPDIVYVWNMGGLSKSMLFTLQNIGIPVVFYLSDHWIARGLKSDVWIQWWNRESPPLHQRALRLLWSGTGLRRRWLAEAPALPVSEFKFPRIYFCSRAIKQITISAGFDVEHAAVIYCPVNTEQFNGLPKPASHPLRKLLFVGRLAPDKGVMTALRAMAMVRDIPDLELSIYGGGDNGYVQQLKSFVNENRVKATFASATADEMPEVYRYHDGLVFPSEWPEPFALTPLEAMASGLPVIGTTTGGSAELFRHGINALTYAAGDPEELASRIRQFYTDSALRVRCAAEGHREVRQRFSEPAIVDRIEEYLMDSVITWNKGQYALQEA